MWKKRKIDFTLDENEYRKIIFRFYPRRSSCHSFGNEPPKSYNDVYKVYFAYSVLYIDKEDNSCEILFDCYCDECSKIDDIAASCKLLYDGIEIYKGIDRFSGKEYEIQLLDKEFRPIGMGVSWTISKHATCYTFAMFYYTNKGYRFTLDKEKMNEFGEYLQGCCDYMLAHGNPI